MAVTVAQVNTALYNTLRTATGLTYAQDYASMTSGMQDTPNLQVYPERGIGQGIGGTDRHTMGKGVYLPVMTFHADLYVRQRAHIGEDMALLLPFIEAINDTMDAVKVKPYFGLDGIQSFNYSWERVVFEYAGGAKYIGAQWTIEIWVY